MNKLIPIFLFLLPFSSHADSVAFCKQEIEKSKTFNVEQKVEAVTKITKSFEVTFDNANGWQKPIDSLKSMSGSVYDLAVLQYYILIDMGIKDEHLKLNYGYSDGFNDPNMTVYVYDQKLDKRYVIDYLSDKVLLSAEHKNFSSVYYFDQKYLWTKNGYSGLSEQIEPWKNIVKSKDKQLCKNE